MCTEIISNVLSKTFREGHHLCFMRKLERLLGKACNRIHIPLI